MTVAVRQQIERHLSEFERAWTPARLAATVPQLPPAGTPERAELLLALVAIDLRRCWQAGQQCLVEDYLLQYPELGKPETVATELVLAEYLARQRAGLKPRPEHFEARFPGKQAALARLVEPTSPQPGAAPSESVVYSPALQPGSGSIHADGAEETQPLPESFGRYRILRRLGQGGMGTVYLAVDSRLDRQVALKVPRFAPGTNPENLERFYREARATATINHPNLCPLYDIGEVDGVPYLTMPFIDGWPLTRFTTRDKRLSQFAVAATVRKIALAVHEAHKVGVIHRDLKPSNIMVNKRGEPIVMDFGLARWVHNDHEDVRLTQVGSILGAPVYMSPEQVYGDVEAMGPGCDVYSLGVILFELLTNRLPFEGGTTTAVLAKTLLLEAPKPSAHRPDVDSLLEAICVQAMAKTVAERFPSMLAFADALGEYLRQTKQGPSAKTNLSLPEMPVPPLKPAEARVVPAPRTESRLATTPRRRGVEPTTAPQRWGLWFGLTAGLLALFAVPVVAVLLWRSPTPRGDVLLTVIPEIAEVQIAFDGVPLDRAKLGAAFPVEVGEHRIVVTSKEFEDQTRTLQVHAGRTERIELVLRHRQNLGPVQRSPVDAPYPPLPGGVHALAASPTGVGLSGGEDFAVHVWNLDRHLLTNALVGHTLPVTGVAVNRTGAVGISCAGDLSVRVWDLPAAQQRHHLTGHRDWPRCVALDAGGGRAVSGDDRGVLLVWDVGAGNLVRTLYGHASAVRAVLLSPDGNRILSAGEDGTIRLWDAGTGNQLNLWHAQSGAIRALAWHPNLKQAAAGHVDGGVRIWNLDTGRLERTWRSPTSPVRGLVYSADGNALFAAYADGSLRAWDIPKGSLRHLIAEVPGGINALTLAPDAVSLLTGGDDRILRGWDAGRKVERPAPSLPANYALPMLGRDDAPAGVEGLAFAPDGLLFLACSDGRVRRRDLTGTLQPTPLQHTKAVRAVAVSHDGRLVASGGGDNVVRVWDRATGEVTPLPGHSGGVLALAFFPDGTRLASGSSDRAAIIWDLETRKPQHRLTGHTEAVTGVGVTSDGKRLVTASLDGSIKAWDAATGQALKSAGFDTGGLTCLALYPDGTRALTGGRDKHLRMWDLATGKQVLAILPYAKPVTAVAVSPCGRWFASLGEEGLLQRWNSATYQPVRIAFNVHTRPVAALAFAPDGRSLVSGSTDRAVKAWAIDRADADPLPLGVVVREPAQKFPPARGDIEQAVLTPDARTIVAVGGEKTGFVWDVASGQAKPPLVGHTEKIHGVLTLDDQRVVTCGWDKVARLWNLRTGKNERVFEGHTAPVIRGAATRDGRYLVTGSQDKTVRVWEIATGRALQTLEGHSGPVWSVAVAPDGFLAVSGSYDRSVRWWDLPTGRQVGGWTATNDIHAVALSPDARRIAAGGKDRVVTLLDVATGREVARFPGHDGTIAAVAFSPDGRLLASSGDDRTARVWNVETGREVYRAVGFTRQVWSVSFSPDGKQLLTGSNDSTVALWDLPDELHPVTPGPEGLLASLPAQLDRVTLSPDGTLLAACGMDRSLRLLDASGQELKSLAGLKSNPRFATFAPDGKLLAASCEDGTVHLWAMPEGTPLRVLSGHARWVWSVAFSPDGKHLLTGGQDAFVLVRDVATGQVLQRLDVYPRGVHALTWLPDGRRAILGGLDGSLGVWDIATGEELERWPGHAAGAAVSALMLTPDGRTLATASYDGSARLWNVATGRQVASFVASPNQLWTVAVDPLGQRLLTGGQDGTLRVWDRGRGIVAEWSDHAGGVTAVRLTPDGRRAVTSSQDRTLRAWGLPPQ